MNNKRKIELALPFLATETPSGDIEGVKIDGVCIEGVRAVHVRAGNNGYTNVVMEVTCSCALEMVAALDIQITEQQFQQVQIPFVKLYNDAHAAVLKELAFDGMSIEDSPRSKAIVIKKLIELIAVMRK